VTTTATPGRVTPLTHSHFRRRTVAVTAAVLTALGVWSIAVPLLGVNLTVRTTPGSSTQTIGAGLVVAVSLMASLLGWALLAVLERRIQQAGTVWTAAAVVVLALSLAGPLTAAATTSGEVSLVAIHLSVAAVLIPLLRRTAPRRL
jgi:uncharacterized phage infection (PIP) family protein YhgE